MYVISLQFVRLDTKNFRCSLSMSKYDWFCCSGIQWVSLWKSDKFFLMLSVVEIDMRHPCSIVSVLNIMKSTVFEWRVLDAQPYLSQRWFGWGPSGYWRLASPQEPPHPSWCRCHGNQSCSGMIHTVWPYSLIQENMRNDFSCITLHIWQRL